MRVEPSGSLQTQMCFGLCSDRARATSRERARLRMAITKTTGANEGLAGRTSHDVDGNRRYSALDRSWFSHRDFLRFHPTVSAKDATLDRCGVDLPLQ